MSPKTVETPQEEKVATRARLVPGVKQNIGRVDESVKAAKELFDQAREKLHAKVEEVKARIEASVKGEVAYPVEDHQADQEEIQKLENERLLAERCVAQTEDYRLLNEAELLRSRVADQATESGELRQEGLSAWQEFQKCYVALVAAFGKVESVHDRAKKCEDLHNHLTGLCSDKGINPPAVKCHSTLVDPEELKKRMSTLPPLGELREQVAHGAHLPGLGE